MKKLLTLLAAGAVTSVPFATSAQAATTSTSTPATAVKTASSGTTALGTPPKPAPTTAYVPNDANRYFWEGKQTGSTTLAHGGDVLFGEQYDDGWFHVLTVNGAPATAKQAWFWSPSATPVAKPIAQDTTRYATVNAYTWNYTAHSGTSGITGPNTKTAPTTAVLGDTYADGWTQIRSGVNVGKWIYQTTATNPYNVYETRQWQNTSGLQATAPTSATVTRYTLTNRTTTPVRSSMSYAGDGNKVAQLASGTALTGHYVNSHWFQITSGTHAGKYVSSGMLFTTNSQSAVNGKLTGNDLCDVPTALRVSKNSNDAFMGCESVQQLIALDKGMYANTGIHATQWEAYRNLATQQQYYRQFGTPQAAVPGTSNHGLGNAMDIRLPSGGVLSWTTPIVVQTMKFAPTYGWVKPSYLMKSGSYNGEPWHFEFNG